MKGAYDGFEPRVFRSVMPVAGLDSGRGRYRGFREIIGVGSSQPEQLGKAADI